MKKSIVLFAAVWTATFAAQAETESIPLTPENLLLHYSKAEFVEFKGNEAVHLRNTPAKRDGAVAFIKGKSFIEGIIEVDIASERFAGIAFRAQDSDRYDKVYFRPFNSGTEKHENSVQYVVGGVKELGWKPLREKFPGKYEGGADLPVMEWFTAEFVVTGSRVEVFVNDSETPVLVVEETLSGFESGAFGIWGWNAYFANFRYTPLED